MKWPFVSRAKHEKTLRVLRDTLEYYQNKYGLPRDYKKAWDVYLSTGNIKEGARAGRIPYGTFYDYVRRKEGRHGKV